MPSITLRTTLVFSFMLSMLLLSACGGGGGSSPEDPSDNVAEPSLSIINTQALSDLSYVDVTVSLSSASENQVAVEFATENGTAIAGEDFVAKTGSLEFSAGETTQIIHIALVDGRDTRTTKTFLINLSNPTHATLNKAQAEISLLDSEHSAMFNNPAYSANWGSRGVFTQANTCANCHSGTTTVMNHNLKDVSPVSEWKHSMMAHALNDPYFNAVVEEETHIFPDKKVFIEDTCLRCHSPMAYTHAHQNIERLTPDPTGQLSEGGYALENAIVDPHAREGVACTACHQIQDEKLGQIESMSGHYKIKSEDENNGVDATIFGQFTRPVTNAMQNQTQYTPEYAAHISTSGLCATCHNLYTPTLDLAGDLVMIGDKVAQFPEQAPYWEWLNSRYPTDGKNCQTCHMAEPEPGFKSAITTKPVSAPLRPSDADTSVFSAHEMVGGNTYLLTLLKTYMEALGIADKTTEQGFDTKIEQSKTLLQGAANLTIGTTNITDNTLTIPLTITNQAGHKLPTSYPSRRMWVHFTVTDNNRNVVFESGKADANGRLAKDTNFTSDRCLSMTKVDDFDSIADGCYEPHHNNITNPEQVAIYESVLGDVNQDITHVLLNARQYLKDNRIPPQGWTLANQHTNPVDSNIKDDGIVGLAVIDTNFATGSETLAGSDGTDTITYQVDVTGGTAPYTIEAELLYQTIKPSFVDALHADDPEHGIEGDSYVRRFKFMYQQTPPLVETLVTTSATH